MALIHLNRGATSLGVFPEEQVREGLRSGRFAASDLGWREGMATWQPLSLFAEFAGEASAAATAPPQTEPATPAPPVLATAGAASALLRSGLPWERRDSLGFFEAFSQTVVMILSRPAEAFTVMRTEGGLADPLLFGVIGGSIGAIVWILMSATLHLVGWSGALSHRTSLGNFMGTSLSGAMIVVRIILAPLFVIIGLFIWAALVHVCLMLVGGAKKGFEASFRALSFAYGATALLCIVPCCGGLIALIWGLIADCIGISRSHEIDTGRAVVAVILPVVICCGGIFILSLMLGVGLSALIQQNSR